MREQLRTARDACFQVTTDEMCLTLPLIVENKVAKVQEASLIIYDYYETCKETLSPFRYQKWPQAQWIDSHFLKSFNFTKAFMLKLEWQADL